MKWYEIRIYTSNEAVEAVSHNLHEYGVSGVSIENPLDMHQGKNSFFGEVYDLDPGDYPNDGVRIKAYISGLHNVSKTVQDVKNMVTELEKHGLDTGKNEVTIEEIDEEDWATAWKKYYKPVRISDKITIKPTWEDYTASDGEIIMEMDPGMAFGTGTHPTTALCMQALEKHIESGEVIMDVGSGSGILSIAAALLGAEEVHAYDLDDIAVSSTQNNARLNGVAHIVQAKQNHLLQDEAFKADMIISNILAEVIVTFVQDAWHHLHQGGLFIVSGIIPQKQHLVEEALTDQHFTIMETTRQDGWIAMTALKTSD